MIRVEKKENGLLHASTNLIEHDAVKRPLLTSGKKSNATKIYVPGTSYTSFHGKFDKILYSLTNVKGNVVADDIYLEDVIMYEKGNNDFITLHYNGSKTTLYINEKDTSKTNSRDVSVVRNYNNTLAKKLSNLFNFIGHVNIHVYAFIYEEKGHFLKENAMTFKVFDMKINGCFINWSDLMYFSHTYDIPLVETFGPVNFQTEKYIHAIFEKNKTMKSIVIRPMNTRKTSNITFGGSEELKFYQEENPALKAASKKQKNEIEQKARDVVDNILNKNFYNSLIVKSAQSGFSISNTKNHPGIYALATSTFMTSLAYLKETAKLNSLLREGTNKAVFEKEVKRVIPKKVRENLFK